MEITLKTPIEDIIKHDELFIIDFWYCSEDIYCCEDDKMGLIAVKNFNQRSVKIYECNTYEQLGEKFSHLYSKSSLVFTTEDEALDKIKSMGMRIEEGKVIIYPAVLNGDINYCPKCGRKLIEVAEERGLV